MSDYNKNTDLEQMSAGVIISIIQDVSKRIYLALWAAVIAALLAFVITDFTYTPTYKTQATFVVSSSTTTGNSYTNISSANSTATVFQQVLNSSILRQKVLEETGLSSFDGTVSAAVVQDTNLLVMTVTGTDPRRVFLTAKGVVRHHGTVTDKALPGTVIEILDSPKAPTAPINTPNTFKNVVRAALFAAAAVTAVLAVLAYLSDKVRTKREADSKLSARVLGEIYHERKSTGVFSELKKKKKSILITNPLTSFVYTESVNKLASRVETHRHKGERAIMVTSVMENEGKSTIASNLAVALAAKGKKVLLIDCDMRKPSCSLIFDAPKSKYGITDVLGGRTTLDEAAKYISKEGIYLLQGRKSLKTAAEMLNSPAMENLVSEAKEKYDYVIIDVPPMAAASDAENICEYADRSLLVVRQNCARTTRLNEAAATLSKNSHLLGCVLNNVYGAGNFAPVYGSYGYGKYSNYSKYGKYGSYGYGKKSDGNEVKA